MRWFHRAAGTLLVAFLTLAIQPENSFANSVFADCEDDIATNAVGLPALDNQRLLRDDDITNASVINNCAFGVYDIGFGLVPGPDTLQIFNNLNDNDGGTDVYILVGLDTANQKNNTLADSFSETPVENNAETARFTRAQVEAGITVELTIGGNPFFFVLQTTAVGSNTLKGFTITAGTPPAPATTATTTSTTESQQQAAGNLVQNRNSNLQNLQPNVGSFMDGSFANGGGDIGQFALRGNDAGFNMSFASSMGRIWGEMAKNEALARRQIARDRSNNALIGSSQSSAFLYGQSVPNDADGVTQTSATIKKPDGGSSGETEALELDTEEQVYGSSAGAQEVDSTSQLAQARKRGYDMWVQIHGAKSHAGNSDSTLWVGYAGAHGFVNDNLIVGGLVQLDWVDESNDTAGSSADGFGWMVGPYLAAKLPDQNLFFDARAAYGRSDNNITLTTSTGSFQTERWLVSAKASGLLEQGDIEIRPAIGVSYFEETQESYTDSTNTTIGSQTFTQGEIRFGPTFAKTYYQNDGTTLKPRIGINGVWNFSVDNGASTTAVLDNGDLRARLEFGVTILGAESWIVDVSGFYDGIGINNYYAYGGKAKLTVPLN